MDVSLYVFFWMFWVFHGRVEGVVGLEDFFGILLGFCWISGMSTRKFGHFVAGNLRFFLGFYGV
jgi:hypothetical protein